MTGKHKTPRVSFQGADWRMLELLPRVRLYFSPTGSIGLGFGWLVCWAHVWLRLAK